MMCSLDFGQAGAGAAPDPRSALLAGLQMCPLLAGLPDSALDALARLSHLKCFREGEVLARADDRAQVLWLILNDGWVKLTRETLAGADAVWDVLGYGTLVGLDTLSEPFAYPTTLTAATDVEVLTVDHATLRRMLDTVPGFALRLLEHLGQRNFNDKMALEHLSQQTAAQRIGCFLLKLAGTPAKGGIELTLPFDKGLLAARLGMQPETFSRGLARLKADTGMTLEGARVRVPDVPALSDYTCNECSGSYPCGRRA